MSRPMTTLILAVLVVGALVTPTCAEPEPLEAYSWLVGVWTARGTAPETGEFTEEFAYEWTMNRKFMKSTYVMRAGDKIVWTDVGMVGIDPASGRMIGINFGMDGTIGWGRTTEEESPESFLMEGNVVGPDLKQGYRVRMRRIGQDGLEFTIETKQGDAYVPQSTQTYQRKESSVMTPCAEPDAASTPEALAGLEAFVGAWRGSGTASGDRAVSLETAFGWRLNRCFLQRVQVERDSTGATRETVEWIGWDPEQKTIVAFAFDADGGAKRATATLSDGRLVVQADGDISTRTSHRVDGEGRLEILLEEGEHGKFVVVLQAALPRK